MQPSAQFLSMECEWKWCVHASGYDYFPSILLGQLYDARATLKSYIDNIMHLDPWIKKNKSLDNMVRSSPAKPH